MCGKINKIALKFNDLSIGYKWSEFVEDVYDDSWIYGQVHSCMQIKKQEKKTWQITNYEGKATDKEKEKTG